LSYIAQNHSLLSQHHHIFNIKVCWIVRFPRFVVQSVKSVSYLPKSTWSQQLQFGGWSCLEERLMNFVLPRKGHQHVEL